MANDDGKRLALSATRLDLWMVFTDGVRDAGLIAQCRTLLSSGEREQEARFHFARDRHRYLMTRALVRDVLSRYAPIPPSGWHFSANAFGRPEVANATPLARRISFNLSHTDGLIVLGVIGERALGIDTECLTREPPLDVAASVLTAQEADAFRRLPAAEQVTRFYDLWTLKESYIKARGMGLAIAPRLLGFRPDDVPVRFDLDASLGDDAARWLFRTWAPTTRHRAAICVERTASGMPEIVVREIVPCGPVRPWMPPATRRWPDMP